MTKPGKPMATEMFRVLVVYLESPLGCDFRRNPDTNEIAWECDGELTITERWLREHQLSVKANKRLLRELGGHCDCEVLFNVVERWDGYNDDAQDLYAMTVGANDCMPQTHRRKRR